MERLLHYVWQHRLYDSTVLQTTDGQRLEVIDPGLHNEDAGPDYLGAQLKIDGITWAGNVEIHTKSSDWVAHGHDQDPAYENVILHVVEQANQQVTTQSGKPIPQVELRIPDHVSANYQALLHEEHFPPCYRAVASLPRLIVRQWLDALSIERLEQKMQRITRIADQTGGDWETVCFRTMARAFGFGINGEAMEEWSSLVPLSAAGFFCFFVMKAVATSFTVGSGGSGGVFAPAIVCGGSLGAAVGLCFHSLLPPSVGIQPAAFALVGMAGFLASAVRIPLTAVVIVAEISGNHGLLLPAMWVCGISFWLNDSWSLYRSQPHSRFSSPVHRADMIPAGEGRA